jgi:hypothetical protein
MGDRHFQVSIGYRKMAMPGMGGGKMPMRAAGSGGEDDENEEGAAKPPAEGKEK